MPLSDEDIREILRIVDETPLAELRVETDGFSLHVVKGAPVPAVAAGTAPRPDPATQPPPTATADTPTPGVPAPSAADLVTVTAPMLGVFYRAEGPGKQSFVEEGSEVAPDTTLCIIEVMKMMNSIPAGIAGTIVEVCQENAAVVEEGAPLFRIRAA